MKKRYIVLFLTVMMLIFAVETGCSSSKSNTETGTPAASTDAENISEDTINLSVGGIMFTPLKEYADKKGIINYNADVLGNASGISYSELIYFGMEESEYSRIVSLENPSQEDIAKYYNTGRNLALIICADNKHTLDDVVKAFQQAGLTDLKAEELDNIGSNEGFNYYILLDKDTSQDEALGEFGAEYRRLCDRSLILSCISFVKPVKPQVEKSEGKLSFETTDVYGNKVTGSDLFKNNKVTMVNIFASWCGPCVNEMPQLEQMNKDFAGMGCGIIGILSDGREASGLEDGKAVINDTGVTYPVIIPWDSFENDLIFTAYPTTYFVDSDGNILDVDPIVGAYVERYMDAVEEALKLVN